MSVHFTMSDASTDTRGLDIFFVELRHLRVDTFNMGRRTGWESIDEFSHFRASLGSAISAPNPAPRPRTNTITATPIDPATIEDHDDVSVI